MPGIASPGARRLVCATLPLAADAHGVVVFVAFHYDSVPACVAIVAFLKELELAHTHAGSRPPRDTRAGTPTYFSRAAWCERTDGEGVLFSAIHEPALAPNGYSCRLVTTRPSAGSTAAARRLGTGT